MTQSLALIALSVLSGVSGQTAIKMGLEQGKIEMLGLAAPLQTIQLILHAPLVLTGLLLYAFGALSWIIVLSRLDLSYAYPFLAVNFVLITLVSRLVLGESVPPMRWMGILVICVGILIVAGSARWA